METNELKEPHDILKEVIEARIARDITIDYDVLYQDAITAMEIYAKQYANQLLDKVAPKIIEETIQCAKEHAEEGTFDHEGAEVNALRIVEKLILDIKTKLP